MTFIGVDYNPDINFKIHSNDGNRIPYNICSILLLRKLLEISFYLQVNPLIRSELYDHFINNFSWQLFNVFSIKKNTEKISNFSYDLLSYYYNDLIKKLSNFLNLDLFYKWNIEKDKNLILSRIKERGQL